MIIVLDTNIVISAYLWGGKPGLIIRAIRKRQLEARTSDAILKELRRALLRPKLSKVLGRVRRTPEEIIAEYQQLCLQVEPVSITRTAADPDDDVVLGTAIAARADLLISGDHHLLNLGSNAGVQIVNAAEALGLIKTARM